MALPQKTSRMLKQLMTKLKDEIYDVDSPYMQRQKDAKLRDPTYTMTRETRSPRCWGNPRFSGSYDHPEEPVNVAKRIVFTGVEALVDIEGYSSGEDFADAEDNEDDEEADSASEQLSAEDESSIEVDAMQVDMEEEPAYISGEGSDTTSEPDVASDTPSDAEMVDIASDRSGQHQGGSGADGNYDALSVTHQEWNHGDALDGDVEMENTGPTESRKRRASSCDGAGISKKARVDPVVQNSAFVRLPPNVLATIYRLLLSVHGGLKIRRRKTRASAKAAQKSARFTCVRRAAPKDQAPGLQVQLLRTCSSVHDEAVSILYGCNIMQFDDVASVVPFFESCSLKGRSDVEAVEIAHENLSAKPYLNLIEPDAISGTCHFTDQGWQQAVLYLTRTINLYQLNIACRMRRKDLDVEQKRLRGALVVHRDHAKGASTALFEGIRSIRLLAGDETIVLVTVRLNSYDDDDDTSPDETYVNRQTPSASYRSMSGRMS